MSTPENGPDDARRDLTLAELLALWQGWNSHDVTDRAARRADAAGDTEQAEKLRALNQHAPSAMTALAAEHELTSLLTGWRWHTVLAAREQGATWADIADATSSPGAGDAEAARSEFLAHLERARDAEARFDIPFHDAERYQAAAEPDDALAARLDDPSDDAPEADAMTTDQPGAANHADTRPLVTPGTEEPALALEDAWFRSALEQTVPVGAPDRVAVIDGAIQVARERFVADGTITHPDEALELLRAGDQYDLRSVAPSLTAAELLVRAEAADNRTFLATSYGELDDALREVEVLEGEAWHRAEASGDDNDRALADYLGFLIEDPGVERFEEYTALHSTVHQALGVPAVPPEDADAEVAPSLAREWGHSRGELRDELEAYLAEQGVVTDANASPQNAAALSEAQEANRPSETDRWAFGEWGDSSDAARWSPELLTEEERADRDGLVVGSIVLPGGLPPDEDDDEDQKAHGGRTDKLEGIDAEIADAYDRGPWSEASSGRQWDSLGAWARDAAAESTAREAATPGRTRVDDGPEIARRLAEVRARVAVRDAALAAEDVPAPRAHADDAPDSSAALHLDVDDDADGAWER